MLMPRQIISAEGCRRLISLRFQPALISACAFAKEFRGFRQFRFEITAMMSAFLAGYAPPDAAISLMPLPPLRCRCRHCSPSFVIFATPITLRFSLFFHYFIYFDGFH
jgi:hypothetical protein